MDILYFLGNHLKNNAKKRIAKKLLEKFRCNYKNIQVIQNKAGKEEQSNNNNKKLAETSRKQK